MTDINVIRLTDVNDIAFSKIAQKSIVTAATFPSGLKIPNLGKWVIIDHYVVNISYINVPLNAPH